MTTRRGFLGAMLAAAVAPAFVKADILMPVRKIIVPSAEIIAPGPILWGDGIHDDTAAFQAAIRGEPVWFADGRQFAGVIAGGIYKVSQTVKVSKGDSVAMHGIRVVGDSVPQGQPVMHFDYDADFRCLPENSYFDGPKWWEMPAGEVVASDPPPFAKKRIAARL
jgi:Rieske Fe-S protein